MTALPDVPAEPTCDEQNELEAQLRDNPCRSCLGGQRLDVFYSSGGQCLACNDSGIQQTGAEHVVEQARQRKVDEDFEKEQRNRYFARRSGGRR